MKTSFPINIKDEEFGENFQNEIWLSAAEQICLRHKINRTELRRAASSDHVVFFVDERFVIKIYKPFRNGFEREKKALDFVGGKTGFIVPQIVAEGDIENFKYIVMTQMSGVSVTRADWLTLTEKEQIKFVIELATGLKSIHRLGGDSFACNWHEFVKERAATFIERQIAHGVNRRIIESLPAFIETNLRLLPADCPTVFLHGDVHFGNLRLDASQKNWRIAGLFDFADSRRGFVEYEFLAVGILMIQGQRNVQREFFKAYGYAENQLDEAFRRRMMMLTMLYESSDLRRYALRLKPEAVDYSLEELEKGIWSFADKN